MPGDSPQRLRIKEVERTSVIFWNFLIGVALTLGTGLMLWREVRVAHAYPDFMIIVKALISSVPLLLFFLVGLAFLGGSAYTFFEKSRGAVWLDVETPVTPGSTLRARVGSDRPLAPAGGVELEATLTCKRRELQSYTEDGKHKTRLVETVLSSVQRRFPLVGGLASCEFELEIPADAPPRNPGAESLYSAQPGVFWVLAIYFPRDSAFVNRSYRIPVGAA